MSQSGPDGTQPWVSSGPPEQQESGGAEGPGPADLDPAAEDPTVITPARQRPQPTQPDLAADDPTVITPARQRPQSPPQPGRGEQTPSAQPGPAPADPTMEAAAWHAQQHASAPPQQPAAYQQPPNAAPQPPTYQQPPTPYQQPPAHQQPPPTYQQPAYEPGPYGAPAPQYAQQPGQPGGAPFSVAVRAKRPSSTRLLAAIGGVVAVIILVVLVVGFVAPGFFKTKELNVDAAQAGVQEVLSDDITGYGAANVDSVTCNNGENPKIEQGATFTCDVRIDGADRQVTATFVDDDGSYEVGPPK